MKRFICVFLSLTLALLPLTVCAEDVKVYIFDVTAEFEQETARGMLTVMNEFRTSDPWYYSEYGDVLTVTGLHPLVYDYELEEYAMQRAAEIAVSYSHTRPNGQGCLTALGNQACGENIAYGYDSAESVYAAWLEENASYSGQGHRRNMINSHFNAVAIGHCVGYDGTDYWVQEFVQYPSGTDYTEPFVGEKKMRIERLDSSLGVALDRSAEVCVGEETDCPQVRFYCGSLVCDYSDDFEYNIDDESIAKIENGKLIGVSEGRTRLWVPISDTDTLDCIVYVGAADMSEYYSAGNTEWEVDTKYASVFITGSGTACLPGDYPYDSFYPERIDIGEGITGVDGWLFAGAKIFELGMPETMEEIGPSAFRYCQSLYKLYLNDGLLTIGSEAFFHCDTLEYVDIPSSVRTIGDYAFAYSGLNRIIIQSADTQIGENAFLDCSDLTIVCKSGSYAERYAIENGFAYEYIEEDGEDEPTDEPTTEYYDEPTTEEPITEPPTTEEPTTEEPTTEAPTTEVYEDGTTEAFEETSAEQTTGPLVDPQIGGAEQRIVGKYIYIFGEWTSDELSAVATYPAFMIGQLGTKDHIGTGDEITFYDSPAIYGPYTIIIPGDLGGDGLVKANDARTALRAAAGLEVISELQALAADVNRDDAVKANDARRILRAAAGLDNKTDLCK